jgi:hypothetical protein
MMRTMLYKNPVPLSVKRNLVAALFHICVQASAARRSWWNARSHKGAEVVLAYKQGCRAPAWRKYPAQGHMGMRAALERPVVGDGSGCDRL